jgi:teichuronic acid biosynthesis glycosyltransferase TuaC
MGETLEVVSVCRSLPTPVDPSGGVFVLNRLEAMAKQANVRIVQPVPYTPGVKPLPEWAKQPTRELRGLTITHAPMLYLPGVLKSLDGMWLERAIAPVIRRMHGERPAHLIDAHFGYPEGVGCVRLGRRMNLPTFITVRGFENEYVEKPRIGEQLVSAMRTAAGCICVSDSLRQLLLKHGVRGERVSVVHNAIDSATYRTGSRDEARRKLGIALDAPLVVSVGHLVSRKRHHVLLDAFATARAANPNANLVIIGARSFEPTYPAELESRARELGIAGATRFLGNIPPREVVAWLQAADIFALGTAREGCCNAVLEALATGLPVVTTPAGDNEFFVRHARNGYIVPIDDAAAFGTAIDDALARKDWDRAAISRELVEQVGAWSDVAARALAFMRERMSAAGAAGGGTTLAAAAHG